MKRETLLKLLQSHISFDENEGQMLQNTIDFVQKNENCFERWHSDGHVTGSAWVVNHDFSKVLMVQHRKLHRWFQPGGHCDGDPNVANVAIREATEETGLAIVEVDTEKIFDVDVHLIPENPKEQAHYHYDIRFLIIANENAPIVVSKESKNVAWVNVGEIKNLNDSESIMRMVHKMVKFGL